MTPAEHAATVRDASDVSESPRATESLAALVALAERATELEVELAKVREGRDVDRRILEGFRDKAEARATELERENEQFRMEFDDTGKCRQLCTPENEALLERLGDLNPDGGASGIVALIERAERAETALRMLWEHYLLPISDEQKEQVRAALGETAP